MQLNSHCSFAGHCVRMWSRQSCSASHPEVFWEWGDQTEILLWFASALARAWGWGPKDAKHFMFKGPHQGCVCHYMFAEVIGREIISDRQDLGLWSTSIEFVGLNLCCLTQPGRTPSFTSLAAASAILKARANALFAPSRGTVVVYLLYLVLVVLRYMVFIFALYRARSRSCDDLLWANKKPCASATLHVTTQILRKSFKFRHRNEDKWNVHGRNWVEICKFGSLGGSWTSSIAAWNSWRSVVVWCAAQMSVRAVLQSSSMSFFKGILESFSNMRNKIFPNGFLVFHGECFAVHQGLQHLQLEPDWRWGTRLQHDLAKFYCGIQHENHMKSQMEKHEMTLPKSWGWRNGRVARGAALRCLVSARLLSQLPCGGMVTLWRCLASRR